jgi:hypothetical protein
VEIAVASFAVDSSAPVELATEIDVRASVDIDDHLSIKRHGNRACPHPCCELVEAAGFGPPSAVALATQ